METKLYWRSVMFHITDEGETPKMDLIFIH